jgi:magnesium transporter
VSAGPGTDSGLSVPFLVDPEHADLAEHIEKRRFFWLDLQGPTEEQLHRIASKFGLHPLTVEDARTFNQRPKLEEYGSYIFLVAYGVDPGTSSGGPLLRELHMIVSGHFVVTIHRRPLTALEELRARYDEHPLRGEQFLVYKILDAMTQTFFDFVSMRRVVSPERDVFARDAERIAELRGLEGDGRLYFRDLYDSLNRVSELVDSYRDLLSGAADMYLSTVANRQGEVNKQLTIIATIFLPLTFLTGFFGQNFSFLTDHVLNTTLAFAVLGIGLLFVSILGFVIYFRRKRWM